VSAPIPLEVVRLEHANWRISNSLLDAGEPTRVMGFIERLDHELFEVLLLVPPTGWAYVESFGHALAAFSDRERFDEEVAAQRERRAPRPKSPGPSPDQGA